MPLENAMNVTTGLPDGSATADPANTPRRVTPPATANPPLRFSMTLLEIAIRLGISSHDAAILEMQAITKARGWARKNGFRLEDLLGSGLQAAERKDSASGSRNPVA